VPYDTENNPGEPSNAVLRPSNEPIIYGISPTEGYQHEEYSFTATVTGAESLTYAWNFGGGATPDTSAEPAPTVTLAEAGEYSASLTVANAYGEASFPFSLIVSERDMWVHTWGGDGDEKSTALALDSQGNVYVAGFTPSFGAGSLDILLLKYTPEGQLVFAKTWGGEEPDASWDQGKVSIAIDSSDNVYVASETDSFGAGTSDSLLLKYDTDGNLIWARTWGGDWIEHISGLGTDNEGNVYVGGYRAIKAFASWDIFVLKYSPAGELQHAIGWDSGLMDKAADMAVDAEGNCYVAGKVSEIAASGNKALVVSFERNGTLRWARVWGTDGNDDEVEGVAFGQDAMLHCIGWTHYADQGRPLLLRYELEGTLISVNTIYAAEGVSLTHATKDAKGNLLIAGTIREEESDETDALITIYRPGETNLKGAAWGSQDSRERVRALAINDLGDLYVTGVAPNIDGTWRLVDLSLDSVSGVTSLPEGIVHIAEGIEGFPEGIETFPEGIQDTGGGGYYGDDLLVLKNCPR
jgi:PKD repeat protein